MVFAGLVIVFVLCAIFGDRSLHLIGFKLIASAFLAIMLLVLSWIDLDRYLLPNWLTIPLILVGLAYSYMLGVGLGGALLGAIIGYGLIFGLALYWRKRFNKDGIGLGDAKLLAAGGAWLGVFSLAPVLLVSSGLTLLLVGLAKLSGHSMNAQSVLPFGPMLAFGIWAVWCFPALVPA